MTNANRILYLEDARALVGKVMQSLNTTQTVCGECKRKHYEDWSEGQIALELGAASHKLHRLADSLRGLEKEKVARGQG